ncbi:PD-(D/E)XK nuclease-like domain-containing protein [Mycolicibacterium brisbanense]|nr:PD-(D/E)XK nuclease-like domain-containing protein [Mycolicibacterium brisbanense]
MPQTDGLHRHVSEDAYHADLGSLSVSSAKLLLPPSSPEKFKEYRDNPRKPKREWDFGHVAHRKVLGKGAEFVVLDPRVCGLTKDGSVAANPRATTMWKDAEKGARSLGLVPIHIDDADKADAMVAKLFADPVSQRFFREGDAEVALYHTDPETGIRLRGRCDWIESNGDIDDYKTAKTANPEELHRDFYKLKYFMQAAWYIDLAKAVGAADNPVFRFIVQEKEPPYAVSVVRYDEESLEEGRRRNRDAIRLFADCLASDRWPGYADAEVVITIPGYGFSHGPTVGDLITDDYLYDVDPLSEEYYA